jgi:hypothetical protein
MKTTTINIRRIHVRMSEQVANPRRTAEEIAGRVAAQVASRSGRQIPALARIDLAGRIGRALAEARRS